MRVLNVHKCNQCKKETYHIGQSIYDDKKDIDYWQVECVICNEVSHIKYDEFNDSITVRTQQTLSLELASEDVSLEYTKQDLFYMLNAYSGFYDKTQEIGWMYTYKIPNGLIQIRNGTGVTVIVATDKLTDFEERKKNLNILLTYIIDACENRYPGFTTSLFLTNCIDPEAQRRIEMVKDNFNKRLFTNSAFGSTFSANNFGAYTYGGTTTSTTISTTTSTSTGSSIWKLLPKTKAPKGKFNISKVTTT